MKEKRDGGVKRLAEEEHTFENFNISVKLEMLILSRNLVRTLLLAARRCLAAQNFVNIDERRAP